MKPPNPTDEYEQFARLYDVVLGPLVAPIRREVCRIALSQGFRNILDICCGTGEQCIMLDRLGLRVTGVDLSPTMLEVAKKKSPKAISYYLQDASDLPFEEHSFDCSILSFALHEQNVVTRGRIMETAKKMLREDGRIIIVDYLAPRNWISELAQVFISYLERAAGSEHYRHYREYMRTGAMASVLGQSSLAPLRIKKYHWGAIGVILAGSEQTRKS